MAALTGSTSSERIIRHAHLFCGLGAGAKGFNMAKARVGNVVAKFVCTGGIDVDAGAIRNFDKLTGTRGTVMDLFARDQYVAFHGKEPPADWGESTPADIRRALCDADGVRPDVVFLSAPCKGFSGLLSSKQSLTDKYQALNALTLRGVWLACEAFKDGPVPIMLFENVPRIMTRGRPLLDQISAILRSYSYNVAETVHDCGELGGLAQSRKRFLLIARQREIIPNFIYEPEKKRLRGVGEVIGKLPLPGDPVAGVLRDYGIVPDQDLRNGALGVMGWDETSGVVIGNQRSPLSGRHSVADPRPPEGWHNEALGVRGWDDAARVVAGSSRPANGAHSVADPRPNEMRSGGFGVLGYDEVGGTVAGESLPTNGRFAVADPRPGYGPDTHRHVLGVNAWDETAPTVSGTPKPSSGSFAVADPRVDGHPKSVQLGVRSWDQTAACVKGDVSVGTGPYAVADPRHLGKPKFNNIFRVVAFDHSAPAVAGPGGPAGGAAVADPRMGESDYTTTKYKITPWEGQSRAVIGASTTGDGAYAVQDPRPICLNADKREGYTTQRHYGVVGWDDTSGAIPAHPKNNNGPWSVADPRQAEVDPLPELPRPDDRVIARIIAIDGTWHRPFTTMDLCALQSIVDPEEAFYRDVDGAWQARLPFDLDSKSDAEKREWIGNAVPSDSAAEVGGVIGEAILLAEMGETFTLSPKTIWVSPARIALAVDTDQHAFRIDGDLPPFLISHSC